MRTMIHRVVLLLLLVAGTMVGAYAAVAPECDIQVEVPVNVDCASAWPFPVGEENLLFCFEEVSPSCHVWFWFEVCDSTSMGLYMPGDVGYLVTSPGGCSELLEATVIAEAEEGALSYEGILPPGRYYIVSYHGECASTANISISLTGAYGGCSGISCEGCIPEFSPTPDMCYIITAWAHEVGAPGDQVEFEAPSITVVFESSTEEDIVFGTHGAIIDGWQRMESTFCIPEDATDLRIHFTAAEGHTVHYDDIRIFPEKGSMKCYVYDPRDLRFVAELDERHYATFYEYDNEGRLARVKKETERGIMTIQETRYNSSKLSGE